MKEISSLQHPLVKHLVKLRQNSDYRIDHHAIVIEGIKVIQEISKSQPFKTIVTTHPDLIPKNAKADETFIVTPEIIQKISGLKNSEEILVEVAMPKPSDLKNKKYIIALDRINDPGNLGTIIRTSLALGWDGLFFLDESCDPYNDKALRASRGAIFHLPTAKGSWKDLQKIIVDNKLKALVADIKGKPFREVSSTEGIVLVLGNEAQGPSKEALSACSPITIPMPGEMDSLNVSVAAGILMHGLRHQS